MVEERVCSGNVWNGECDCAVSVVCRRCTCEPARLKRRTKGTCSRISESMERAISDCGIPATFFVKENSDHCGSIRLHHLLSFDVARPVISVPWPYAERPIPEEIPVCLRCKPRWVKEIDRSVPTVAIEIEVAAFKLSGILADEPASLRVVVSGAV